MNLLLFFFFLRLCVFLFEARTFFGNILGLSQSETSETANTFSRLAWTSAKRLNWVSFNTSQTAPPFFYFLFSFSFLFFCSFSIRHQFPVCNLASLHIFKFNESRLGTLCCVVFPRRASRRQNYKLHTHKNKLRKGKMKRRNGQK